MMVVRDIEERDVAAPGASAARTAADPRPAVQGRILIATYHFPPAAAVGGLRLGKFARCLPESGWEPHVLTIRDDLRVDGGGRDESRLRGLDGTPVVTTGELPRVFEALVEFGQRIVGRRSPVPPPVKAAPAVAAPQGTVRRESLARRLSRYYLSLAMCLPDDRKNWSLRAAATAVGLIRRRKIDWILTSGPPFSVHIIGIAARFFTRARWAADFRDPWIGLLHTRPARVRSRLSDALERRMERAVVRLAHRVILTSETAHREMRGRYPDVPDSKFVWIPNSIDTDALRAEGPIAKYDTFTITYAGTLYFDRSPETLFAAVRALIHRGVLAPADIRIKLIGHCHEVEGEPTEVLVRRYGLEDVVEISPPMPYADVVRIMRRSHVLLVLAPGEHELIVPAKLYDYLGSGSSVLVLAEPGATADMVAKTKCGVCLPSADVDGLTAYLASILENGAFRTLGNDPDAFSQFDVHALTRRLTAEMAIVDAEAAGGSPRMPV